MTNTIDLNGEWTLRFGRQQMAASSMDNPVIPDEWPEIPARVPGNVELDLIREGLLPHDLEMGHNIYELRKLEDHQWWFERKFHVDGTPAQAHWKLIFDGVDTLATVWLNGKRIAELENMNIPHRIDVSGYLQPGENTILIGIDSVVLAAKEIGVMPGTFAMENNWESLSIRKAAHGFGWDIMPRVMSAGLWRGVRIEEIPPERFRSVYLATVKTDPALRSAMFGVRWDLSLPTWPSDGRSVLLEVSEPASGKVVFDKRSPVLTSHGQVVCDLEDIDLWWPRGAGEAALYDVRLSLIDADGAVRATWSSRFGFRTIRLDLSDTTDFAGNGKFDFIVNGERIFIKGTNWVPLDALHSRDPEHMDDTLAMLADLNCNMIRCWGGNVYEPQAFFDFCDANGIMVWQDFSLACALYPQTSEFHEKVRNEAEAIVPLLRNHPSMALWAGNNEIDTFYTFAKPWSDPNEDDRISRFVLPEVCRHLDPCREYLPSSPYFSKELWAMGAPHEARPEDHLWGPRNDFKGSYYLTSNAHFVSEIGYHGCPDIKTMRRIISPDNLWPWQDNEEWITHAVRPQLHGTAYNYRIPLMANQIKVLFGEIPDNLEDFIFASQVTQAEALKFFVERFRSDTKRYSGILWWNLRDGWPIISDAIVDYYGERKLAYAVIKRLQADVCVMLGEAADGSHRVVAVNGTLEPVELSIRIDNQGSRLFTENLTLDSNSSATVGFVRASDVLAFYGIEWESGKTTGRNHYIAGPRPFDLAACRQWYVGEFSGRSEFIETKGAKVQVSDKG
jgi:beta-mannosidase